MYMYAYSCINAIIEIFFVAYHGVYNFYISEFCLLLFILLCFNLPSYVHACMEIKISSMQLLVIHRTHRLSYTS